MTIIETVRNILESFPKISAVLNSINIDFAAPEPTSYGLTSTGDTLISEDILGNQTRRHTFMLYSTFSGINDFERLTNSNALLELAQWLSTVKGTVVTSEISGVSHSGEIISLTAENGAIEEVPQENSMDGIFYHIQIIADYTVNNF